LVKIIILFVVIAFSVHIFASGGDNEEAPIKVAVIGFAGVHHPGDDTSRILEVQTVADMIEDEVVAALKEGFVVERKGILEKSLKENNLPISGVVEDRIALKSAFKELKIKSVLMGRVEKESSRCLIDMILLNIETGRELSFKYAIDHITGLRKEEFKKLLYEKMTAINRDDLSERDFKRPYKWPAIALFSLGAVSLGTGFFADYKAHDAKKSMEKYNLEFNWKKAADFKDKSDSYITIRNGAYIGAGVSILAGTLLFFITEQESAENALSFEVTGDDSFLRVAFSYKF